MFNPLKSLLPACAQVIWQKLAAKVQKSFDFKAVLGRNMREGVQNP